MTVSPSRPSLNKPLFSHPSSGSSSLQLQLLLIVYPQAQHTPVLWHGAPVKEKNCAKPRTGSAQTPSSLRLRHRMEGNSLQRKLLELFGAQLERNLWPEFSLLPFSDLTFAPSKHLWDNWGTFSSWIKLAQGWCGTYTKKTREALLCPQPIMLPGQKSLGRKPFWLVSTRVSVAVTDSVEALWVREEWEVNEGK